MRVHVIAALALSCKEKGRSSDAMPIKSRESFPLSHTQMTNIEQSIELRIEILPTESGAAWEE